MSWNQRFIAVFTMAQTSLHSVQYRRMMQKLQVSKNKVVIFPPIQFHGPLEIDWYMRFPSPSIPRTLGDFHSIYTTLHSAYLDSRQMPCVTKRTSLMSSQGCICCPFLYMCTWKSSRQEDLPYQMSKEIAVCQFIPRRNNPERVIQGRPSFFLILS
jgi:hypothetical protein